MAEKMKHRTGLDLFLRFAEGCRKYLEDNNRISKKDNKEIKEYLYGNGDPPSKKTLKRVFYAAYPGIEKVCRETGKSSIFDPSVVRTYYAFAHNRKKHAEGNLICIAYPAKVIEKRPLWTRKKTIMDFKYEIELEPVLGRVWIESDIPLKKNDWIVFHRAFVVEKISKQFADRMIQFLSQELGLDKSYRFPKKAIKYLNQLAGFSKKKITKDPEYSRFACRLPPKP